MDVLKKDQKVNMHLGYFVKKLFPKNFKKQHNLVTLDTTNQLNLLIVKTQQSSCIQTSKTGGQLYSDTSFL